MLQSRRPLILVQAKKGPGEFLPDRGWLLMLLWEDDMQRYSAFGVWLREHFGQRVYKVSVDGGFTCPNRDGTAAWGGCTYCNNDSFRPDGAGSEKSIQQQVRDGISYLRGRFEADRFLIYWQNYSNTYAPAEYLRGLYQTALDSDPRIVGMTIGTRPDCIDSARLEMIQEVARDKYVCMEYGLESIYDETLRQINRGHDVACFSTAAEETRKKGIPICTHVILGFPNETREQMLAYPAFLNKIGINFLKIHHLHVVKGTPLAKQFLDKPFPTFNFSEWIELVADFLERLDPGIVVQRLYGWCPYQYLIAPRWNRNRAEILQAIAAELERRESWQGKEIGAPREFFQQAHLPGQPMNPEATGSASESDPAFH